MYICGEQFKNICDFYFYYDDLYAKNDHIIYHNLNNNKNKTEIKGHSFNPNRTNVSAIGNIDEKRFSSYIKENVNTWV